MRKKRKRKGVRIGYKTKSGIINSDLSTYIPILRFPKTGPVSWPCLSKDEDAFPL